MRVLQNFILVNIKLNKKFNMYKPKSFVFKTNLFRRLNISVVAVFIFIFYINSAINTSNLVYNNTHIYLKNLILVLYFMSSNKVIKVI